MSTTIQAALLGIVQGLTEFLPVSSSAHLILARVFLGFDTDQFGLSFDVACHVGTLIAVLIYFRVEVARMIAAVRSLLVSVCTNERSIFTPSIGSSPRYASEE